MKTLGGFPYSAIDDFEALLGSGKGIGWGITRCIVIEVIVIHRLRWPGHVLRSVFLVFARPGLSRRKRCGVEAMTCRGYMKKFWRKLVLPDLMHDDCCWLETRRDVAQNRIQ